MVKLLQGDRIGKLGHITLGCSAAVFDPTRQKLLLTRRTDNGRWCFPGGRVDPGESVEEACLRELLEETGLRGRVVRLIGVYSSPHYLLEYKDGERCHIIALHFEVEAIAGSLCTTNETTAYGYYTLDEIAGIDLMEHQIERIQDTLSSFKTTFVK